MGTTYHVTAYTRIWVFPSSLNQSIESRLTRLNQVFSTYIPSSEISQINQTTKVQISDDMKTVLESGKKLYSLTNGAWDGTVFPLVKLWGFYENKKIVPPKHSDINNVQVGFDYIQLNNNQLIKPHSVEIDLSSIAKGYAVDQIGHLLKTKGITSFMVEIGGEVLVGDRKKPWVLGIQSPTDLTQLLHTIELTNRAMATSGDYQQYFEYH